MAQGEKIIGIDLGTTYSVVAVMEGKEPKVIPNQEGNRLTPSVVAFTDKGEMLVGEPAKRQAVTNSARTVYSIKRFMGRRHSEVGSEEKIVPYKVVGGPEDYVKVKVGDKEYTPPEISAMILASSRKRPRPTWDTRSTRRSSPCRPTSTTPSGRPPRTPGKSPAWKWRAIINEPTAASLAYGLDKKKTEKIVVFDLGGGTFDVSVLEVAEGVFRVISTNGDTHLGGDDFDQVLVITWPTSSSKEHGIDLRKDTMALQRLQEACEKAKRELSSAAIDRHQPALHHGRRQRAEAPADAPHPLQVRAVGRPSGRALPRAGQPGHEGRPDDLNDIDEVVLVGGSTRIPKVQELGRGRCSARSRTRASIPDEVVAVGAAIQGGVLAGEVHDVLLLDVTPLSLGIETLGGIMTKLVERNTTIPTERKQIFSTADDNQTAVTVKVFQGERQMAADNRLLGQFNLEGIPPAPRGLPQIEVKFDIDANGILNVSAKDLGTGKEQTVRIEQSSGLSESEIEQDAARRRRRTPKRTSASGQLAEPRNQAESMCWQLEKLIKEHDAKLNAADKEAVKQGDREDPRSRQGRRRGSDQGGRSRVGAGLARLEQDALRVGRRPGPRGHARRRRRQDRPGPARRGRRRR